MPPSSQSSLVRSTLVILLFVAFVGLLGSFRTTIELNTSAPKLRAPDIAGKEAAVTAAPATVKPTRKPKMETGGDRQKSYDIRNIIDGEEIRNDNTFKQLHHGIYRVVGKSSGVQFALKTECRPPAKWHGQQGWSEVGVYSFASLFYKDDPELNSVPPARGITVHISEAQMAATVHKDRCGVLEGNTTLGDAPPPGYVRLVGVALTWQSSHDENALPPRSNAQYFVAGSNSGNERRPMITNKIREYLNQISDVQVLDYLLGNEDREDKNWFWNHPQDDASRKLIMMDNGWAFSGVLYQESICGNYDSMLKCPPLLRYLAKNSKCRHSGEKKYENCRFRHATLERVNTLSQLWENRKSGEDHPRSDQWRRVLAKDPLIVWLLRTYDYLTDSNKATTPKAAGRFSMALARYVHNCPEDTVGVLAHQKSTTSGGELSHDHPLLLALAEGLSKRLKKLLAHVNDHCVQKFGNGYVFGNSQQASDPI